MPVHGEWVHYADHSGYLALPEHAGGSLPAVVVIQELFGVNEHIEEVTRRIAAAGYAALAPDLFAVDGERPAPLSRERITEYVACGSRLPPGTLFNPASREAELAKLPEPEQSRLRETIQSVTSMMGKPENFIGQLRAAIRYLRTERPETRGQKVACVGFCMGGGLSALLACEEPELAGAAVFYGTAPAAEKVSTIHCPVIGFYGATDQRINAGLPGFEQAMRAAGKSFEPHVYEGAGHGFFNDTRPVYNVAAARDSFARLLNFFVKTLAT